MYLCWAASIALGDQDVEKTDIESVLHLLNQMRSPIEGDVVVDVDSGTRSFAQVETLGGQWTQSRLTHCRELGGSGAFTFAERPLVDTVATAFRRPCAPAAGPHPVSAAILVAYARLGSPMFICN